MSDIRDNAIPLEVKKHAYRQTQDGIVISFVMHPNDVSPELAAAPLGTRYMAALVQVGEDEQPVVKQKKESLARQAGILCGDVRFLKFLAEKYQHIGEPENDFEAAEMVRAICGVDSRREFDQDTAAGQRWRDLEGSFKAWMHV